MEDIYCLGANLAHWATVLGVIGIFVALWRVAISS